MSLVALARRLGAASLASAAMVSFGSQPVLNFDVEALSPKGARGSGSRNPLIAIEALLFPLPPLDAPLGPSMIEAPFEKKQKSIK